MLLPSRTEFRRGQSDDQQQQLYDRQHDHEFRAGDLTITGGSINVSSTITNSAGAGNLTISGGLVGTTLTQYSTAGILTVNQPVGFSGTIQNVNGAAGTTVVLEGDPTSSTAINGGSPFSTAGQIVQFNGGTWTSIYGGNFNSSLVLNGGTLVVNNGDCHGLQGLAVHQGGELLLTGSSQYGLGMGNYYHYNADNVPFTGVQDGGLVSVANTSTNGCGWETSATASTPATR